VDSDVKRKMVNGRMLLDSSVCEDIGSRWSCLLSSSCHRERALAQRVTDSQDEKSRGQLR